MRLMNVKGDVTVAGVAKVTVPEEDEDAGAENTEELPGEAEKLQESPEDLLIEDLSEPDEENPGDAEE